MRPVETFKNEGGEKYEHDEEGKFKIYCKHF
jgi:hypothetical protein